MPTVPLYIRSRQWERLKEMERLLKIPWQEIVRTAVDEFLARNSIEELRKKVEARMHGKGAKKALPAG